MFKHGVSISAQQQPSGRALGPAHFNFLETQWMLADSPSLSPLFLCAGDLGAKKPFYRYIYISLFFAGCRHGNVLCMLRASPPSSYSSLSLHTCTVVLFPLGQPSILSASSLSGSISMKRFVSVEFNVTYPVYIAPRQQKKGSGMSPDEQEPRYTLLPFCQQGWWHLDGFPFLRRNRIGKEISI